MTDKTHTPSGIPVEQFYGPNSSDRLDETKAFSMSAIMDRLSASVYGRVQGVSFRYYTRREAANLSVNGWVRNERDGSVLVVAEGERTKLEELVNYLHKGPPAAIVERVDVDWSSGPARYSEFGVRWL